MENPWIPWPDRNEEFAPVIGLHRHHMFYPTTVDAFIKDSCELMILVTVDSQRGPIYGRVKKFAEVPLLEKIQYMVHKKMNKRSTYLDRHGGDIDMRRSRQIQNGEPSNLYVRGFRNTESGEAYITYWFWYVENFVPRSTNDREIEEILNTRPDSWWSHEGDWEGISVHFRDYQSSAPDEVIFSQHEGAKAMPWTSVTKEHDRILAIPALGSHATYNAPLRKKRFAFYAEVASPDFLIYPVPPATNGHVTYQLTELNPYQHSWLYFKGRWGQSGGEAEKAPTGPLMKSKRHFELLADKPPKKHKA